jgi:hypothetical protein
MDVLEAVAERLPPAALTGTLFKNFISSLTLYLYPQREWK